MSIYSSAGDAVLPAREPRLHDLTIHGVCPPLGLYQRRVYKEGHDFQAVFFEQDYDMDLASRSLCTCWAIMD